MWELEALGIGNLARIKEQRGEQSKAIIDFFNIQDMVAADVTQAQADLQSAAARVDQADRALRTGIATFNGSFEGLQHTTRFGDVLVLINRPQEVVFALQLMKKAFDDVLHDGRRIQQGAIRVCSTRSATPPARSPTFGLRARSNRWTRHGPIICPRWAMGRPRQPAETHRAFDRCDQPLYPIRRDINRAGTTGIPTAVDRSDQSLASDSSSIIERVPTRDTDTADHPPASRHPIRSVASRRMPDPCGST